jgi:sugar O-acyltransferase (sialic acid O-acetyltransferase NeuD family)
MRFNKHSEFKCIQYYKMIQFFYGGGGHFKVASEICDDPFYVFDERQLPHDRYWGNLETFLELYRAWLGNRLKSGTMSLQTSFFISIGDNATRKKIVEQIPEANFTNFIHPSAIISPNCKMGVGNIICAGAVIESGSEIGNHCIINTNSSVNHDCKIGDFVHIAPGSTLCGNITIGETTLIGAGTTIIPKITIGKDSIIGAGSVVVRDIANNVTAFGNPCKVK